MAGLVQLDGRGQVVQELSPYEADLDSVSEPDEIMPLLGYLGQATAEISRLRLGRRERGGTSSTSRSRKR